MPKSVMNLAVLFIALIFIFGVFCMLIPNGAFLSSYNLESLLKQAVDVTLVALGMTFVIISGGIDLSVGSIAAFASVSVAWLLQKGYSPVVAMIGGVLAGGVCGLLNGTLITKLKVVPFIVTLGSLLIVRGAAKGLANEQKIDAPETWLNNFLAVLGPKDRWQIFPVGVWITIVLAVLMALVLRYTRFGRHVIAIGSNEQAARLCGVPLDRTKVWIYTISGLCAGLGGLMLFSRLTVGDPTTAQNRELDAIAAVVIGGASLSGGEGSIAGAILGALIMQTIKAGGSQLGLSNWVQEVITGCIIVLAVAVDRLRARKVVS